MKISHSNPPNITDIEKHFTINEFTVITYGNVLYNPGKWPIDDALMAHEETHMRQQAVWKSPDAWWSLYLVNKEFRLSQELEAYKNQYNVIKRSRVYPDKSMRLIHLATDLSSNMYGAMVDFNQALKMIRS